MSSSAEREPTIASADEVMRALYLLRAWEKPEPTNVGGVHLKLDCDCDKEQWQPLYPLGCYGDRSALYGPELAFPWTPDYVREFIGQHERPIDVTEGCTVIVDSLTPASLAPMFAEFAPSDQREGKFAYLLVVRPDGEVVKVKRPLILLRANAIDALLAAGNYNDAFRGLVDSLEKQTGILNIEDLSGEPVENWPIPQRPIPHIYGKALIALLEGQISFDFEPYVAFGYLMAKAEATDQLLSSAMRGRLASETQAKAAVGRREKSRQETDILRTIARGIIQNEPDISLTKCAKLVESSVVDDPSWKYKSDAKWIAGHIKELFERRANGVEYRPKRSG